MADLPVSEPIIAIVGRVVVAAEQGMFRTRSRCMSPDVRIGISGWTYTPWRGEFYPKGLPQKKELAHAASVFRSIEINGTFYSMQRVGSFAQWADATPDDFVFAVKGPRYLT